MKKFQASASSADRNKTIQWNSKNLVKQIAGLDKFFGFAIITLINLTVILSRAIEIDGSLFIL